MKRIAILGSIVAAGLMAVGVSAQQGPPPGAGGPPRGNPLPGIGAIEKVSDNVYKIFGAGGNTTFFVRSDGVVLVDTKLPNNGAAILAKVREITDKPVTMIINTHSHPDHLGSNTEIETARGSVQVVVQANTAARMATMPSNNKVSQSFQDRLTLGSGPDQIDLYWFGPAHTDGDAFIVWRKANVVHTGDVYFATGYPFIDISSGGTIDGVIGAMDRLLALGDANTKVIPGHGPLSDLAAAREYRAMLQAVRDRVSQQKTAGQTLGQVVAAHPSAAFDARWGGGFIKPDQFVEFVYRSVGSSRR